MVGFLAAWLAMPARAEPEGALFQPVHDLLQHPRCSNCHAPDGQPLQRDGRAHQPRVPAGPEGKGQGTLACANCHKAANSAQAPGAPDWHMPVGAAAVIFAGQAPGPLCRALRDPARNGGRDAEALGRHFVTDRLVLWAWNPGGTRAPPPVSHEAAIDALAAWLKAGAPCPD